MIFDEMILRKICVSYVSNGVWKYSGFLTLLYIMWIDLYSIYFYENTQASYFYCRKKVLESPDKKSFKNEVFSITFPEPLEFAGYDKSSTQDADKPSTQENNESSTQENDESSTQESDKSSTKECDSPINSEDPLSSSNPGDSLPSNNSKEAVPDPNHPLFGHMYHFYLDGVVDCPEFLVHQETLKTWVICDEGLIFYLFAVFRLLYLIIVLLYHK